MRESIHTAPALLLADSHGLNKAARLSEGEGGDKQDAGAPAPSSKFRKRWQRAKFALAFRARDDAEHREAKDIAAAWDGASTSEDERSVANSDDPDEDDDDDVNDENQKDATLAELRARAREELLAKEKALCDAVPRRDPSDPSAPRITKIVWSFQNLKRVPPGFIRLEGVRDGLESLDLSMNILTKAPSNLARCERLVELDLSHNRLTGLPPALARCKRLHSLAVNGNRIKKLGTWIVDLPDLRVVRLHDNPMIDPPPEVSSLGVDRIREYLRAMQAVKRWDPERVVGFDRGGCEYSKAELSAHFRDRYVSEEEAERARLDALARRVPSNGTELRHAVFKPAFFRRFTRLTRVDVSGARLESLPGSMAECEFLTTLEADGNRLGGDGALPDLGGLKRLKRLSLRRCELKALPEWIARCGALEDLVAAENAIVSPLPSLETCASMNALDLSDNSLRTLPNLPKSLRHLFASGNKIDDVSIVTKRCVSLETLDVERNKITSLPDDLAGLTKLVRVNVRKNLLREVDPPSMHRRASSLRSFRFSGNPLGAVPWWLPDVADDALEEVFVNERRAVLDLRDIPGYQSVVDLGNRGLLHTPALLPHLPNLTQLTLSHNSLGFLPSHLSDLVHMRGLRLDHNFLTFLPDLSKMKRLRELRVDNNRLQVLSPSVCKLAELESLYIGRNPISKLPDAITACVKLRTLWMADCQFEMLPLTLADVPKLENFYAEGNPLKFPEPSVYEEGGNNAVLGYLRSIAQNEREQREMEKARKEKAERAAARKAAKAKARWGAIALSRGIAKVDDVSDESSDEDDPQSKSGEKRSKKKKGKDAEEKGSAMGRLLWRRVRAVVLDDGKRREEVEHGSAMNYDMLLRARAVTRSIRVANAEEEMADIVTGLEIAKEERERADAYLLACVNDVKDKRKKCEDQRELMRKYVSINGDVLKEMQFKLRDSKGVLVDAVAWKDRVDADVAARERALRKVDRELDAARAAKFEVKQEQAKRAQAKLEAKMRRKAEEAGVVRRQASRGSELRKKVEAEVSGGGLSLFDSMGNRGGKADARDEANKAAAMAEAGSGKGAALSYMNEMGMEKGDEAASAAASKAWAKMQMLNRLGVFSKQNKDDGGDA